MGGGGSKSKSKPLNAKQRADIYDKALERIGSTLGSDFAANFSTYQSPDYASPGAARTLTGGDYDALQQSIYDSSTAGLADFEKRERERVNQDAADRGIWSSGLAMQAQNDVTDTLAQYYRQAGADAATQRYQLQSQELAGLNNYNLQESAQQNSFNQGNASSEYESQWRPLDYLAGIFAQGSGTISTGSSNQWSI